MQRASVALAPWVIQGMSHAPVKNFGGMKMNSQNVKTVATEGAAMRSDEAAQHSNQD